MPRKVRNFTLSQAALKTGLPLEALHAAVEAGTLTLTPVSRWLIGEESLAALLLRMGRLEDAASLLADPPLEGAGRTQEPSSDGRG